MNCTEITTRINEIKTKKAEFDNIFKTDIPKAIELKKEIQSLINELKEIFRPVKEILNPVFEIEGKKFPVQELEIGGKTIEELEKELLAKNIWIIDPTKDMFYNSKFTTLPNPEQIKLVKLKVSDLGFPDGATTDEIYTRAQKLGLELCPAEVGPYQRLNDADQPLNDWYYIAMKQILDQYGNPDIFGLECHGDGFYLSNRWARPAYKWDADDEFMFSVRPSI